MISFYKKWGLVYWNSGLYRLMMRLIRSGNRSALFKFIAAEIGNRSVFELCPGPGDLKRWIPNNTYSGLDKNPQFVKTMKKKGLNVEEGEALSSGWPSADCLVMVDSLYHFIPVLDQLMSRAINHGFKKIIIADSVQNFSSSQNNFVSKLAVWMSRVDGQSLEDRFTKDGLKAVFEKYNFKKIEEVDLDLVGIWTQT